MEGLAVNCGTTEIWLATETVTWEIHGVQSLFHPKLLPVVKLHSPSFAAPNSTRKWHLELVQSKPDFLKCVLIPEDATVDITSNTGDDGGGSFMSLLSEKKSDYLTAASTASAASGAVINEVCIMKWDGSQETFSDIKEKYEETNGWREWAGKFVEKRRKAGITEYIFGMDFQAYENAFPWLYVLENRNRYIAHDTLKLQAEILFTGASQRGNSPSVTAPEIQTQLLEQQTSFNNKALVQNLCGFYNMAKHSDLTLLCGCRMFPVHKVVIEARAPFMAAEIFNRPKFTNSKNQFTEEPPPGDEPLSVSPLLQTMRIEDMKCHVLDVILRFIYAGKLPESPCAPTLTQVSQQARRFQFHDLTFSCFLKALELHKNASTPESKGQFEELMNDIYFNNDASMFNNRFVSMSELRQIYPQEFAGLDGTSVK